MPTPVLASRAGMEKGQRKGEGITRPWLKRTNIILRAGIFDDSYETHENAA